MNNASLRSLMIHCSTLGLRYAFSSSWYNDLWTLCFVRPLATLFQLLMRSTLFIFRSLYTCLAGYISSIIRFSLVRLPLDITSNILVGSINICSGIGCLKTSFICLQTASASSNKSAKAITPADYTTRATIRDL